MPKQVSRETPLKVSRCSCIQVSRYPVIQVSRYPDIQVSWYPGIQVSRYPGIQVSRYPGIQVSRYIKLFDLQKIQFTLAVNGEYKETDTINYVQSSLKPHPLWVTLKIPMKFESGYRLQFFF